MSGEIIPANREIATLSDAPLDRDLIKDMAMDIGKEVVAYIERMYPQAITATSSTFSLSVRNCIHNEIMAALETKDAAAIRERLVRRKTERRRSRKVWRDLRNGDLAIIERNLEQSLAERDLSGRDF